MTDIIQFKLEMKPYSTVTTRYDRPPHLYGDIGLTEPEHTSVSRIRANFASRASRSLGSRLSEFATKSWNILSRFAFWYSRASSWARVECGESNLSSYGTRSSVVVVKLFPNKLDPFISKAISGCWSFGEVDHWQWRSSSKCRTKDFTL